MLFIRQGATHKVVLGPAVAVGDGFTPVTTLALTTADEAEVILHDNGTVVDISGYTWAAITTADGYYHLTLQSGISNTIGHMIVVVNDDSLCLPVKGEFTVLEEAVYDQLFASSAPGASTVAALATAQADLDTLTGADGATLATSQPNYAPATAAALTTHDGKLDTVDGIVDAILVDTAEIGAAGAGLTEAGGDGDHLTEAGGTGDQFTAITAFLNGLVIAKGTIGATGNDTTHLHLAGLTYGDDEINNYLLAVQDVSAGEWHARYIEDWADTGDLVTVATLPFTPEASVDLYVVLAFRQDVTGGSGLDAAGVRAAVGLAAANLDTQLGTIDTVVDGIQTDLDNGTDGLGAIKTDTAAILVDTGTTLDARIPAALVGGRMDSNVGAISADATAADNLEAALDGTGGVTITAAVTGNVTGNLSGSVGSVTGAVGSVTGAVGSVAGNVDGNVTGSVGSLAAQAKADVNAEADTAISDAALATAANLATVDTVVDAIKVITDAIGATAAANLAKSLGAAGIVSFAVEAGTLSTTQATTDLAEATDDHYKGRVIIWITGDLAGQATDITAYTGATGLLTFTALTEAPQAADTGIIV